MTKNNFRLLLLTVSLFFIAVLSSYNTPIAFAVSNNSTEPTVHLDKNAYSWTDRVNITVTDPTQNLDPDKIDTIGNTTGNQIVISTRGHQIPDYKLVETGPDTGVFTGYVTLTGNSLIKGTGGVDGNGTNPSGAGPSGSGPTDGQLPAQDSDGISVSYYVGNQTVVATAPVHWNIGSVTWLQSNYPANGQGVLQITDPDMNLNPNAIDKFAANVWSDSDSGGILLYMTETGPDSGIFQGTVYFTNNTSSGNRLHVSEGDTVTGDYDDMTLPPPYTTAGELRLTATTSIKTTGPLDDRIQTSNPRLVDQFGNAINSTVDTGQQIQVTVNLVNNQDKDQPFAHLVQIQDSSGVTVSLSWITGTITAGQSLDPAQSWTPSAAGVYTAKIFILQSIDNPSLLSKPLTVTIMVAGAEHSNYNIIKIPLSGTVNASAQSNTTTLMVYNPDRDLVQIDQANVTNTGAFNTTIDAGGPLFRVAGIYSVQTEYDGTLQNNLSFNYTAADLLFNGYDNSTQSIIQSSSNGTSLISFIDCLHNLEQQDRQLFNSLNKTAAISLAKNSTQFQSIINGSNYSFYSLSMGGLFNKTTCTFISFNWNLVFITTSNGTVVGQVYVEENPSITQILNITVNKDLTYSSFGGIIGSGPAAGAQTGQPTFASVSLPNGTGTVDLASSSTITDLQAVPNSNSSTTGKPLGIFPYGLLSWKVMGLTLGQTVQVNFTFPSALPNDIQYWKFSNGIWTNLSSLITGIYGNILTLSITDGGPGDSDGLANGVISDPGGILVPTQIISPGNGGSTPGFAPSFITGFSAGQYPLTINGTGIKFGNYQNNVLQTQTIHTGKPFVLKLLLYGDGGSSSVQHVTFFTDMYGNKRSISASDTLIAWDKNSQLSVVDPHHFFQSVSANPTQTNDGKFKLDLAITFANPMPTSDMIIRTWGTDLYSVDVYLPNVWQVVGPNANLVQTQPATQQSVPTSDLMSVIKEWDVPDSSVSDSQLLQQMGISASHIPSWVTKSAQWVSSGQVPEQDFIKSINYLYLHGIIK
jgi:hypothetical protein